MTTSVHAYEFLLEWDFNGATYYFSMFAETTTGGHTYTPRIVKADSVGGVYIDRTYADWQNASLLLDDLDDEWGTDFYFTALNAVDDFEDDEVRFYLYDRETDTKTEMFTGLVKRPKFSPDGTCQFEAAFPVDAVEVQVPAWTLGKRCVHFFPPELPAGIPDFGCTWAVGAQGLNGAYPDASETRCDRGLTTPNGCIAHNNVEEFGGLTHLRFGGQELDVDDIREQVAPIVIGDGPFKVRPTIYRAEVRGSELWVNGIISTTHPDLPFEDDQFVTERFKLWGEVRATAAKVWLGTRPQAIPGSRDNFPEAVGHSLWCYFFARFPLTPEQKDRAEQTELKGDVTVKIDGGRQTLDETRTENPVRATIDVIRDRINGAAWPDARIDLTSVTDAANYVSTRFRGAYRFNKPQSFMDWLQEMLGSWHGYVSYEAGKLRIGAKRHDETAVATFGTGGYTICAGVKPDEKDFSDLTSGVLFRYKDKLLRGHRIPRRDVGAQTKAANGGPVKAEWEKVWLPGIYDEVEARISSAIWMREEINLDYFIEFATPLPDWISSGARAGDVIRVNDPRIIDNADNYLFRVTGWVLDPGTFEVTISAQFYEGAVYEYDEDELGDILRDGESPSTGGRPADMLDPTAEITDYFVDEGDPANTDDDTRMAGIACSATYPDLSADQAEDHEEGYTPERGDYPLTGYQLYWRFDNEPALHFNKGPFVKYPETDGRLEVPFHKKRKVQILFASVARNNHTGEVGYVMDPTRTTWVDEDVDDTQLTIDVGDGTVFSAVTDDEYIRSEGEFMKLDSLAGDTLTLEADDDGNRAPQLGSVALEHPEGTEIGVAKLSHPSVTIDMGAKRFTLGVVQDVVLRRRDNGVRVHWADLDPEQLERYLAYWSLDENAFGVDADPDAPVTPQWYLDDPLSPPEAGYVMDPGDPGGAGGSGTSYFTDSFSGTTGDPLAAPWVDYATTPIRYSSGEATVVISTTSVYSLMAVHTTGGPLELRFGAQVSGPIWSDEFTPSVYRGGWSLVFGVALDVGNYREVCIRKGYYSPALIVENHYTGFAFSSQSVVALSALPGTGDDVTIETYDTGTASVYVLKINGVAVLAPRTFPSSGTGMWCGMRQTINRNLEGGTWTPKQNFYDDFFIETRDYGPGAPPVDPTVLAYGINLIKNKDLRCLINYEEIEAAGGSDGSPVYVRVAGKIKRNFSVALSNLAQKKHHRGPLCAPPEPDAAFITSNQSDGEGGASVDFTLPACEDDGAVTFDEADVHKVILKFRRPKPGGGYRYKKKKEFVDDGAVTDYVVDTEWKKAGVQWEWISTTYKNHTDHKRTTAIDPGVFFTTGGFAPSHTGGATGIGAETPVLVADNPASGLSVPCHFSFNQGSPQSVPDTFTIEEKVFGASDSTYLVKLVENVSAAVDDAAAPLVDAGSHTITRAVAASDFGTHYTYRATMTFASGPALIATDDATVPGTAGGGGGSSYTDEMAQDAVGAMIVDTATIDLTYTDATPELKADVKDGSITFAKLLDATAQYRIIGRKSASAGDFEEVTASEFHDFISATQGVILYRGASTWDALAPSTDGYQLTTHGASANPTWDPPGFAGGTTLGCRVRKSADQTISNNTTTAVTFDTEDRDDGAWHSTVTNTERLTVPAGQAGWYVIVAQARWEGTTAGSRRNIFIKKNGTDFIGGLLTPNYVTGTIVSPHQAVCVAYLAAADYVEMYVFQDTGGNLKVLSTAETTGPTTLFSIARIATTPDLTGVRAVANATQSLTNNTAAAIAFATETRDDGAWHDNATNNTRLTCPSGRDGWYTISGHVRYGANATGLRSASIRLNGSTVIASSTALNLGGSDEVSVAVACAYYLVAGDYVELVGLQTSGGSLSTSTTSPASAFSLTRTSG